MTKSFIEVQFPVSKVSKESYKERKAGISQTLTGLGKWWGRKPLILVRAAIIGLLMPVSDDPVKDRQIFLKILTMDEEGLWKRKNKNITQKELYQRLTARERQQWFDPQSTENKPNLKRGLSAEDKQKLQRLVFNRMKYDEKLTYCDRPEQIDGPSEQAWKEINAHLGTNAKSLPELVQELGKRRFGHIPRVGDAFCGGGSVPFEAARLGCEAYGSDLNPVAALLTWAALNIVGGGPEVAKEVHQAQQEVYEAVDRQITAWGIEHNELGWRADAYLYCNEVICPECGWKVPLAQTWIISENNKCIAKLVPDEINRQFEIDIICGVTKKELQTAEDAVTVKNSDLICPNPNCRQSTPITMLRGDWRSGDGTRYGLRLWENEDIVPRPEDVFQERLYCIRWVETYIDEEGREQTRRHYRAPDENDMERERRVLELLRERFHEWQEKGYIPSRRIEPGDKTDEPIRTRGWTYWHHLFTPRQLLMLGSIFKEISKILNRNNLVYSLLMTGRFMERNSKLCGVDPSRSGIRNTFANQALNTNIQYGVKGFTYLNTYHIDKKIVKNINTKKVVSVVDARKCKVLLNIWLTDPPYADAINYHELSEFFLAWYENFIPNLFSSWYTDTKRALAITGTDESFRISMVQCYRNLTNNIKDNGMHIVMFT